MKYIVFASLTIYLSLSCMEAPNPSHYAGQQEIKAQLSGEHVQSTSCATNFLQHPFIKEYPSFASSITLLAYNALEALNKAKKHCEKNNKEVTFGDAKIQEFLIKEKEKYSNNHLTADLAPSSHQTIQEFLDGLDRRSLDFALILNSIEESKRIVRGE